MSSSQAWHASWVHTPGSVVVITGAGSGIGMSTALLAAQQGYKVAAWDVNESGLFRTKELAGPYFSSQIFPILCDVSKSSSVSSALSQTLAEVGNPLMLVNNAGPIAIGKFGQDSFMEMMEKAMSMIHYPTEAFLGTSPERGASIVNISSIVGPLLGGGGCWYSTAKAGVMGYSKNMAVSLKERGIRVNTVAPGGPIKTPRNADFLEKGTFDGILERNPSQRPGRPEEVANAIMFLLSPAASYINGHMLCVDGGLSIAE
ncbi:hypothetical protein AC578_794 [Pseudocercospora eumusae]|uniref:Uncharacterized protein n=1 Tax=Pseudocercospora eumusae TaxID=321146 RepID=A0A139HBZ0_9PEZI|nr:hypothetical protein AC578_794 [Pseudocercospora eumusae]